MNAIWKTNAIEFVPLPLEPWFSAYLLETP
jgi:hypothetical protein